MANQREAPSYAAQLAAGATSLTEAWDGNPNSSQNHLMLGHIEEWFYSGLAGFRASDTTHIRIEPEPVGDVSWVKATRETVRGPVHVSWEIEGKKFRLKAQIPPGIAAEIAMPAAGKRVVHRVGSGDYSFETER
jgi:hypothetical protein